MWKWCEWCIICTHTFSFNGFVSTHFLHKGALHSSLQFLHTSQKGRHNTPTTVINDLKWALHSNVRSLGDSGLFYFEHMWNISDRPNTATYLMWTWHNHELLFLCDFCHHTTKIHFDSFDLGYRLTYAHKIICCKFNSNDPAFCIFHTILYAMNSHMQRSDF